jgi:hypothetical protein
MQGIAPRFLLAIFDKDLGQVGKSHTTIEPPQPQLKIFRKTERFVV